MLTLYGIIANESVKYRLFFWSVFWFQVVDVIDYILTDNETWFKVGSIPITNNSVGAVILAGILFYDYGRSRRIV